MCFPLQKLPILPEFAFYTANLEVMAHSWIEMDDPFPSSGDRIADTLSASGSEKNKQISSGSSIRPLEHTNGHTSRITPVSPSFIEQETRADSGSLGTGNSFTEQDEEQIPVITVDHPLGYLDVVAVVFNKMVGTGIFTTPGLVLRSTGSKRTSLILWAAGGLYTSLW